MVSAKEQLSNKYSQEIIETVRQRFGLKKDDDSSDQQILEMSKNEIFSDVVRWNGLLGGYEDTIKYWILDIYGIDLDEVK